MTRTLVILTTTLLLATPVALPAAEGNPVRPNLLVMLTDDLGETKNLAAAERGKVADMKTLLEKLITNGRSTPGPQQPKDGEVKRYSAKPAVTPKNEARVAK